MSGPSSTVLVAGGTGVLGSAIASRLLAQGRRVRVLTRDGSRASALGARDAEIVVGDLRDRASLDRACRGVAQVMTTANAFIGRGRDAVASVDVAGNRNLIDAARAAGVERFVFTSAWLTTPFEVVDYFAAKLDTEAYLRASGVPWTILRPTAFMETWAMIVGAPLLAGRRVPIFGSGATRLNLVAVDNVAEVAVLSLDRGDARNSTVDIAGPENLTMLEVVEIFGRATGRTAKVMHVPVPVMRALAAVLGPVNPVLARQMRLGVLAATVPQEFDAAPLLARYPVRLLTLEEWVRATRDQTARSSSSRAS